MPTDRTTATLSLAMLGQLSYHVSRSARLAVAGTAEESATHALLAWALLESIGDDLDVTVAALDLPDAYGDAGGPSDATVRRRAGDLALQLCSHFTSEGEHVLAQLYLDSTRRLAPPD